MQQLQVILFSMQYKQIKSDNIQETIQEHSKSLSDYRNILCQQGDLMLQLNPESAEPILIDKINVVPQ